VTVATYDLGGDGPAALFVHATGFHARAWLPVVELLRDRFHCYAFDQTGHGDSPAPDSMSFDWSLLGRDTADAVAALGLSRPLAVGHSSGAAALLMAEASRPGTFAAIWAYEPIVVPLDDPLPPSDNGMSQGARRRREVFGTREEAYENFASKPPFSSLAPAALRAYVDYGFDDQGDATVRLKCRGDVEARYYMTQASHATFRGLGAVACPTTVVRGEPADRVPASFVEPIAARLPDASVAVLPGADHFGPLQQPEAAAASIAAAFTR
jgi:pimeloyl-ACP methyl ester carboxylesterase